MHLSSIYDYTSCATHLYLATTICMLCAGNAVVMEHALVVDVCFVHLMPVEGCCCVVVVSVHHQPDLC